MSKIINIHNIEKGFDSNKIIENLVPSFIGMNNLLVTNKNNIIELERICAKIGNVCDIVSFEDLPRFLLNIIGFDENRILNKKDKILIISYLLLNNNYSFFDNDSIGNIADKLVNLFEEFDLLGLTQKELDLIISNVRLNLKNKFQTLIEIKKDYEKIVQQLSFLDNKQIMYVLEEKINEFSFDNLIIDFSSRYEDVHYSFLYSLTKVSKSANLIFGSCEYKDELALNLNIKDIKIYQYFMKKILDTKQKYSLFNHKDDKTIQSNLLFDKEITLKNSKFIKFDNSILEVEYVIDQINILLNQDISIDKICIVVNNLEGYRSILSKKMIENNIPYNIIGNYSLKENDFIKALLELFDIVQNGFLSKNVIALAQNPIFQLNITTLNIIEDFFLRFGDNVSVALKNGYKYNNSSYNIVYNFIIYIENLLENFKHKDMTPIQLIEIVFNIIEQIQYIKFMTQECNRNLKNKEEYLAKNKENQWNLFVSICDRFVTLIGSEKVELFTLLKLFEKFVDIEHVSNEEAISWLDIITLEQMKNKKYDYVFCIGCYNGVLEQEQKSILNDYEREFINKLCYANKIDIKLNVSFEDYCEKAFCLYSILNNYNQSILFSYPEVSMSGQLLQPLNIMKNIFKQSVEIIENNSQILENKFLHLLTLLQSSKRNEEEIKNVELLLKEFLGYEYYGNRLNNIIPHLNLDKTKINTKKTKQLLMDKEDFSITSIEKMNDCCFKYFMSSVLKPKEKKKFEETNANLGTLFHRIYYLFYQYILDHKIDTIELEKNNEKFNCIFDKIFEIAIEDHNDNYFISNYKNKFVCNKVKHIIKNSIIINLKQLNKGDFKPYQLEKRIEMPITTKYGDKKIIGIIDRVDKFGNYLRVLDYKTSSKDYSLEKTKLGISLQLPMYSQFLYENNKETYPIGMYYSKIINPKRTSKDSDYTYQKKFAMSGYAINDRNIVGYLDNVLKDEKSNSVVVPIKISAKDEIANGSKVLLEEEYFSLLNDSKKLSQNTIEKIIEANIVANPINITNYNSCEYCQYKRVCQINLDDKTKFRKSIKND